MPRFAFEKFPQADDAPDHADEVGRRGDGDRPHLPGVAAEGAARAGDRHRAGSTRSSSPRPTACASRCSRSCARSGPERLWYVADAFRIGLSRRGDARAARASIPGSSRRSRSWSASRSEVRAQGLRAALGAERLRDAQAARASPTGGSPSCSASGDAGARRAATRSASARCTSGSTPAPPSSPPHRLPVLHLRGGVRGRTRPSARKIMVLGGGPNRIGQGIEFDYCCVHAALRAARGRLRDHHGQLQPGDRVDRLRHLRPAVLRAADARGRARDRPHGAARRA